MLVPVLAALAGLLFGALAMRLHLGRRMDALGGTLAAKEAELLGERQGRAADRQAGERILREKESALERLLAAKDREFAALVRALEEKFANLAATTLEAKSQQLTETNRAALDAALKPLADQMAKFQNATQQAQNENRDLGNAIHKDIEAIGKYARDLSDFSVAITSGNTVQGRKGEDILAEKLRQAGLEEGVSFFLQEGEGGDRPDAQVCDAENRWLVIDSKVSLTAFIDCRNERLDEATRRQRLKDHVESVRGRIVSLRDRKYPLLLAQRHPERNYLPVSAMFVPYEAALSAALEADPSLWQLAAQGNVVLVTPMNLIAYLRLVYLAWQHKKVEQRYLEIVKDAGELLARMNSFLVAFENVGKSLENARAEYDGAWKVIVDRKGGHTIGGSARKLQAAGIRLLNRKGESKAVAKCLAPDADDGDQLP
ncbi:MAG: DNA recombination protein RmuC [Kiritimatiellia bacterium]